MHSPESLAREVRALRSQFRKAGYYERPVAPVIASWVLAMSLGIGGAVVCMRGGPLVVCAAALAASSLGFLAAATIAHTASHGAASDKRWVNAALFYLTYPLGVMMSAEYWHHSHIVVHHPAPNVIGHDDDSDLRPFFAINERHVADASDPFRALHRVQGWLLPLVLPLNGFSIQQQAWRHLLGVLVRGGPARRASAWADLACMVLHVVAWILVPMIWLSPGVTLGVYAIRVSLLGFGLFAVLAPGHYPAEAHVLDEDQRDASDFYLRQTATTVNFRTGVIGSFVCSGLQYQIEHHLFPSISHVHLATIAPQVRELCERHGLPYRSLSWSRAIWESWLVFFRPKRVVRDVETLRVRRVLAKTATTHQAGPQLDEVTDA